MIGIQLIQEHGKLRAYSSIFPSLAILSWLLEDGATEHTRTFSATATPTGKWGGKTESNTVVSDRENQPNHKKRIAGESFRVEKEDLGDFST